MRKHEPTGARSRRRRFDDDLDDFTAITPERPLLAYDLLIDDPSGAPPADDDPNWSSWGAPGVQHGPEPYPEWVITDLGAVDTDLGVLKTGKEADVHLVERAVPGTDRSCLLAAKRYRGSQHRMFHRDAGYLEGRRVRRSRETRAMANRTLFGRDLIAGQWAAYEFAALGRLWQLGQEYGGIVVPYPVQLLGTELMLEFVSGGDGAGDGESVEAAPRLAQLRPGPDELAALWEHLLDALTVLARAGFAHGDLSPYNILVRDGRPVLIDLPQVVDVVANPQGPRLLARDVSVVCTWFNTRGLPDGAADPETVTETLLRAAGVR